LLIRRTLARTREGGRMTRHLRGYAAATSLLLALCAGNAALAQKPGGILKMYSPDSPASMSIHEEATVFAEGPMMGVLNNLVMYDQHVPQNSLQSIVPDLATSWSWSEEGTALTFPLRLGVTWHDGKPFTAKDVGCTFDMLTGKSVEQFRVNPRKSWYGNLEQVTTNGDYEVTFHLKQPQPAFLMALASGFSPIYPCHVPSAQMRQHPIGPLNSSSSSRTSTLGSRATPITGRGTGLISTASSIRSSRTCRRRTWRSFPASST
jgi:peptide/nickel transport system substrate-binding protein